MGKNKLAKFAEMKTLERIFEYPFDKLKEEGFPFKGRWRSDIFKNNHPIVLELGCGKGEYTVGLARIDTQNNYIGIDIKGARMWSGAKIANQENLTHVAFIRTHIELIHFFFEENEVDEIWITFPDPQMKKVGKRMTSTRFMQLYRKILSDKGVIHLKCDSPFMYIYTKAMAELNQLPVLADTIDIELSDPDNKVLNIQTYYEQQWRERGMSIKYFSFLCLPNQEWKEPEIEIEYDSYRSFNRSKRSGKKTTQQ